MAEERFVKRTRIEAPAEAVFAWHARAGALERLIPPWAGARILERTGGIENGARVVLQVSLGPARVRWVAEHRDYVAGRQFRDVQVEGPLARWEHTHTVEPDGPAASILEDRVDYRLPLGPAGRLLAHTFTRRALERMLAYRHRITAADLAAHALYSGTSLHVAVTGTSGLVGSALASFLTTGGHRVTRIVRSKPASGADELGWNPAAGMIDAEQLEGVDAVVHLAGESIASGRWSAAKKARIHDSRVRSTRLLCRALARLKRPPRVLVCASAIGFYGDRGDDVLAEDSPSGSGFLAGVCRDWEAATEPAVAAGLRVVCLRLGVVLTAAGGALATMLPTFRFGAGGVFGTGTQYMSWIGLDDVLGALLHVIHTAELTGPVNAVAPEAVTNREFTRTLAAILERPALLPVPALGARLAFGAAADELLLASTRVTPARLLQTGYSFRFPDLASALEHTLGQHAPQSRRRAPAAE